MVNRILIFSFIILQSCSHSEKYKMVSMLDGENYIDVTDFVVKEGYKPIYCKKKDEICALINPKPISIGTTFEAGLKGGFKKWMVENNLNYDKSLLDKIVLANHSKYQYSYIIFDNLVDVYKTEINLNNQKLIAYFRIEKENLILPYKEDGWIIPNPVSTEKK